VTETSSALVGFAVLRANYNATAPSYVDNFRGFVLGVLLEHAGPMTRDEIASRISLSFGINIPDLVVGKIIKRAKHTKHIDEQSDGFVLTKAGLRVAPAITSTRDKYLRQQRDLEERFLLFVGTEFPDHKELTGADIASELGRYLEDHAIPVLASSVAGRAPVRPTVEGGTGGYEYVVARFVTYLYEYDDIGFSYLEEAAKGAILSSVVTLDTTSFKNSLSKVSVYIDTPVLLDLMGYSGAIPQRATTQLTDLIKTQGAKLLVFEHTLRELSGVLRSAENYSRNTSSRVPRAIDLHFQDQGWSAADIFLAAEAVPEALDALGIVTAPKPENYHVYGLDEDKLESALQEVIHYKYESSRRYDVESLSAIHRLRKGSSRGSLDRCVAVLLTANSDLARASQKVEGEAHEWPLAMTDSAMAGMLWARSPAVASELPRKMVVAAAYAGMQPEPMLWAKYVEEVGLLEARGEVSADNAVVLRSTSEGKDALMEATLGKASELTQASPLMVLDKMRVNYESPLREELDATAAREAEIKTRSENAIKELSQADEQVKALRADLDKERQSKIDALDELERRTLADTRKASQRKVRAGVLARRWIRCVLWVMTIALVALALLSLAKPVWLKDVPWLTTASFVAALIVAALAILQSIGHGSIVQWLRPLEAGLAKKIYARLVKAAEGDFD
jgi:hypothetical protein